MTRRGGFLALVALLVGTVACGGGGGPTNPTNPTDETAVVTLTAANFAAQVLESREAVMVDFYLPTCPHCRAMAPIVEDLARAYAGRAVVGQVDVSRERDLMTRYAVEAVPTFVFFKDGREISRRVGETTRVELVSRLEAAMAAS